MTEGSVDVVVVVVVVVGGDKCRVEGRVEGGRGRDWLPWTDQAADSVAMSNRRPLDRFKMAHKQPLLGAPANRLDLN